MILVGWGLAQRPVFLPGLTVAQAAAPEPTLIAVVVAAVLAGGLILAPSLALLFRLVLGGRFDPGGAQPALATPATRQTTSPRGRAGLLLSWAVMCLAVGVGLLSVVEIGLAHAVGVVALLDSSFWRSSASRPPTKAYEILGDVAAHLRSWEGRGVEDSAAARGSISVSWVSSAVGEPSTVNTGVATARCADSALTIGV